ncbi:FAD:protein FMN transferase [Gordonia rhizosphera]|uniref:FAD:protein FMN transferase n=1 Tax=Gordonia rhizosphera NBRC 16068 TaxID=1108045 RepID=K6WFQ5_9ACTN|nr:FAD:protein FMN transferase [Gordonia rhizosphera]GAB91007.1 ApbE family protein [Gordonia rhizosphera NBRC 16068]
MTAPTAPGDTVRTRAWVEHIMGMPISIHVRAEDPRRPDVEAAVAATYADLRRADATFSTWDTDSQLMRLRAGTFTGERDAWLDDVAAWCAAAERATGGAFTTDLVGPDGTRGWDPTGLVKGWAVTEAAAHLRRLEGVAFSINAGGDILCGRGPQTPARPWRIGIQHPGNPRAIAATVELVDGAVATSGTGARGTHIIDPRTHTPVQDTGSVTVTGPDLVWCDIWATACFVDPDCLTRHPDRMNYRLARLPA